MSRSSLPSLVATGVVLFAAGLVCGRLIESPSRVVASPTPPASKPIEPPPNVTSSASKAATDGSPISPENTRARFAELEKLPPSPAREERRLALLVDLVRTNPQEALERAHKIVQPDVRMQALTAVLTEWAKHDPTRAWETVTQNTDPAEGMYVETVLVEIGKNDPTLAEKFASKLAQQRPEAALEIYISAIRGVLHNGDFERAREILDGVPSEASEARGGLTTFLASQWGRFNPEAAAFWIQTLPPGEIRDQALLSVDDAWADLDPRAAAQFAVQLPSGQLRQVTIQQAISKWATQDTTSASQWILEHEPHPDFDQAISSVATSNRLLQTNISLALDWAQTIFNDGTRLQTLSQILSIYAVRDKNAARAYVESAQIPADMKQQLLANLENP
jgi:hypothetical protein